MDGDNANAESTVLSASAETAGGEDCQGSVVGGVMSNFVTAEEALLVNSGVESYEVRG